MMLDKEEVSKSVSRETFERLEVYVNLLEKWNPKINLVARSTLQTLWTRHIHDSLQFYKLMPTEGRNWVDFGSGGGFPGLVLAILAQNLDESPHMTLVESDQRKSVFLRTVIRETGVNATVLSSRIEETPNLRANAITVRALADLTTLLGYSKLHLSPDGICLFAKGKNWKKEVSEARETWQFDCDPFNSETEPDAVVLRIQGITYV